MPSGSTCRPTLLSAGFLLIGFGLAASANTAAALEPPFAVRPTNSDKVYPPSGGYAHAVSVEGTQRLLFVSGQIPVDREGNVPTTFSEQCRLVWSNILAQLAAAGMGTENIVKVNTYLADRAHAAENSRIRQAVLGKHRPALTVVIADIYDPQWLLEIEVVAAAPPQQGDAGGR